MSLILSDQPGLLGPKACNFLTLIELVSLHLLFSQHRPCQILKRNYYPLSFCNLCMPVHIKLLCLCRRWNFKGTLPMEARSPSGLGTRLEIWRSWGQVPSWRPGPGACFSKFPKTFRARKPFVKLQPANSVKLVFSYVVKGIKSKITAKFPASRRLRFEYTKYIFNFLANVKFCRISMLNNTLEKRNKLLG